MAVRKDTSLYRDAQILPKMVSKAYFEQAKVVFGVSSIAEYKNLLEKTTDTLDRLGVYRVPPLLTGLMYDSVGSIE